MASCVKWDNGASRVSLEDFRQFHENDKQWAARSQFMARHLHLYPGPKIDQLIALSVVWSNIVFIGNRYGEKLTEKVHKMAEGIDIGEIPSFELVPGAKKTKRSEGTDAGEQPQKKFASRFGPRPRFEPVHFVVSSTQDETFQERSNCLDSQKQEQQGSGLPPDVFTTTSDTSDPEDCPEADSFHSDVVEDEGRHDSGNFMSKIEQSYSAKFNSHCSTTSKEFRHNVLDMWIGVNKQGRKGIGFVKPPKMSDKHGKGRGKSTLSGRTIHSLDKAAFINQLSAMVVQYMLQPTMKTDSKRIKYTFLLTHSIQSCKTNPEYIYAPLKDISPLDLPQNKKLPVDGFACEVRCQDIYLATGYSFSKNGARDRAAEQAVHLLLQRPLEVRKMNRKCGLKVGEDWVACQVDKPLKGLPPALKQENGSVGEMLPAGQQGAVPAKVGLSTKQWTEFIITENACDAIGILNNSATINKMTVEYKYTMISSCSWKCSVFVQGHCVAEGYGNKKNSKHAAAKEAVRILKDLHPDLPKTHCVQSTNNVPIKELKDIIVYANSINPVCTLNNTAQFNNITVDYVFERVTGDIWKCKVLMEKQFLAEAMGLKKTVKHEAAGAAVNILKQTQPVVVNNPKKGPDEDAISRNQIRGWSSDESFKQQIKEDNIGNQLLRKMGWKGGGLGKEGEGISEPISVKEQFSREGLGLTSNSHTINKRDIEKIIRNYAASYNQDDLTFSKELSNEERKYIHQISQKYGLKSKSHGHGNERFLVVSRKRNKQDLIHQLIQDGQVGSYALLMPQQKQ
ncbi:hypothetical protein XENTR_v10020996 [Xenopus tropicalis]|uniref:NF-kappa-B-repressing factor n=1 Tax=Xenopus tropicalis TaxID=8364 RepID=Q28C35_XENTR|nr:NF-kappa-B-repressing factor [Xenopus tropicalis]AAI21306.1 NFKB repressing factor [Xenopus tropicalis]KAE8584508.1 hypothetical protein XENTR_v10020996 [Xenopus tropicalis]CAJ81865.1 similar to nkrf (NF-kappaB repressing factor) [Xenopus tropicalis]|eukprot:NP_001039125.1 NF-kappa-B-repressing factor [Xenopus tropicalis]